MPVPEAWLHLGLRDLVAARRVGAVYCKGNKDFLPLLDRAERWKGVTAASRGDGAGERLKDPQTDVSCSPGAGLSAGVGAGEFGDPFVPTNVKSREKEQSSGV